MKTLAILSVAIAATFGSCYTLVELVPESAFKPQSDGGVWVTPEDPRIATKYVDGKWAEEYHFDDQHRTLEWLHDDASGARHIHKYDPETGEELSHEIVQNPEPKPNRPKRRD